MYFMIFFKYTQFIVILALQDNLALQLGHIAISRCYYGALEGSGCYTTRKNNNVAREPEYEVVDIIWRGKI